MITDKEKFSEEIGKTVLEAARGNLELENNLRPIFLGFGCSDDGIEKLDLVQPHPGTSWDTVEGRFDSYVAMYEFSRDRNIDAVVMISEAWSTMINHKLLSKLITEDFESTTGNTAPPPDMVENIIKRASLDLDSLYRMAERFPEAVVKTENVMIVMDVQNDFKMVSVPIIREVPNDDSSKFVDLGDPLVMDITAENGTINMMAEAKAKAFGK